MIIIEDTKEQVPINLNRHPEVEMVISNHLDYGDYMAVGCDVVFERKGLGDLFGTLTSAVRIKRFKNEMNRAFEDGHKIIIIIEGSYSDIRRGYEYSKVPGKVLTKTLHTYLFKYKIPFICCTTRTEMVHRIVDFYYGYFKNLEGK